MTAAYLKGSGTGERVNKAIAALCVGKVRFDSAVVANRAARRRGNRRSYRCLACGGFHVGTGGNEPTRKHKDDLIKKENK